MEMATLLAIAGMALATYATRVAGLVLLDRITPGPRMKVALDAVPIAVLTAVIAPGLLAGGPANALAGLITIAAAWRLPLLAAVAVGVVAVAALRVVIG